MSPRVPGSSPRDDPAVSRARHQAAVDGLRAQLAAIAPDAPVRLRKRTSNLFRPRQAVATDLDVSQLTGVVAVDPARRTAVVQGMTTYETLLDATLAHGLMPLVVPQLKSITLGGAVTGLGIESSSFRHGLPHESVRSMHVLTGTGEILECSPTGEHSDLFHAFPNSYGSLGYCVDLTVDLMPVKPYVHLHHLRFTDLADLIDAVDRLTATHRFDGGPVDFLDGVVFSRDEAYLTVGSFSDTAPYTSDYTGRRIYYRSIQQRAEDYLTVRDYLWRWDTDWFWCSRALFVQNPAFRRIVPKRWLRSDVYGRIVRWENRHGWFAALDARRGKLPRERVVQDVEVPLENTRAFLDWFLDNVPIEPVWLCPLAVHETGRGERPWPLYPMRPGRRYVNVGFWSSVEIADGHRDGDCNRAIETRVTELDGHKSLYSDAYYDENTFWSLYGGDVYPEVKSRYDPNGRFTGLYEKAVDAR